MECMQNQLHLVSKWHCGIFRKCNVTQRFKQVREEIEVGKMSGAVGTFANIPPEIESYVCKHLGIGTAPVSTQTLQRDRHAYYIATLALIATSLEKFAVEIRNLQNRNKRS